MVDAKKEDIIGLKKNFYICLLSTVSFLLGDKNRKRVCGSFFLLYNKKKNDLEKKYNLFSNKGKRYNKRLENIYFEINFFYELNEYIRI